MEYSELLFIVFIFKLDKLQGDIVEILDSGYNRVVSYEYDSWGNILSIKDSQGNEITDNMHIGLINLFRYRGYYYDNETKWYYLNSRYYNPEWERFLNADFRLLQDSTLLGNNLYLYTANNLVNRFNLVGNSWNSFWNRLKKSIQKISSMIGLWHYCCRGLYTWKTINRKGFVKFYEG